MKNLISAQASGLGRFISLGFLVLVLMVMAVRLTPAWAQSQSQGPAAAQAQAQLGALNIQGAYVKPTLPGQVNTAGYLKISNQGATADQLLSASSSSAQQIQLHFMGMQGDVMKMNEVSAIDLPPGQSVELKPGSYHLMIMGLKAPLKEGEQIKIKLKFQKAGELELAFAVFAAPSALPTAAPAHHHGAGSM